MKLSATVLLIGITCLFDPAFAAVVTPATADPQPEVTVDVFALHSNGKIVYHYRVFNRSPHDIAAVTIGLDNLNDDNPTNDIYELYELPSGWNIKYGIPSTSSNSPNGWRVNVTQFVEKPNLAVTWEPLNAKIPKLLAGQILTKMSVAVDKADTNYLTGHALITYTEGTPAYLTVPLENLDTTPPEFTVKLNPEILPSPDGKLVPVKASFTVKDDYDRKPEIKLESIIASEATEMDDISDATLGLDDRYLLLRATIKGEADRVYTVTYSATDASGNQTMATATVTSPLAKEEILKQWSSSSTPTNIEK